jgi:hypothetical protein
MSLTMARRPAFDWLSDIRSELRQSSRRTATLRQSCDLCGEGRAIVICRRRLGIDDEALNNTEKISDPMLKFLDQQFR